MNGQPRVIHFLKRRMNSPTMAAFEAPLFSAKPLARLLELTTNTGVQHKSYCSQSDIQCRYCYKIYTSIHICHLIFNPKILVIRILNVGLPLKYFFSYVNINYEFSINLGFSKFLY